LGGGFGINSGILNIDMIIAILINGLFAILMVITAPLRLLPDVALPAGFTSSIATASGYISSVNSVAPISTMLSVLGAMIAVEVAVILYRILVWVLTKIPGISN